jgi:hypothetical protein
MAVAWALAACGGESTNRGPDNGSKEEVAVEIVPPQDTLKEQGGTEAEVADPGEAGAELPPACSDECEDEGQALCEGAGFKRCQDLDDDGCLEWTVVIPCPGGQACDQGACVLSCADQPCTVAGARHCKDAGTVESCGDYNADGCLEWGDPESCDELLTCSGGFCITVCSDDCTTVGARKCEGNSVVTCGDNDGNGCLDWGAAQPAVR